MKDKKTPAEEYVSDGEKREKKFSALFPKQKDKKKKNAPTVEVQRFNADVDKGLNDTQVNQRIEQGLVNKTGKKYSKTYRSIFI